MERLKRTVIKEEFVKLTGDFKLAIVLNQMLYWSQFTKDFDRFIEEEKKRRSVPDLEVSHGWIYKTSEELAEETLIFVSAKTMREYLKKLVENGWIEERRNPHQSWDHTKQYRMNLVKLQEDLFKLGYMLEGYPIESTIFTNTVKNIAGQEEHVLQEIFFDEVSEGETAFLEETETLAVVLDASFDENVTSETVNVIPETKNVRSELQNEATIPESTTEITSEIKKEYIVEIVAYLNEKAGKSFQVKSRKTQELVRARWKEGYRLDDFKKVIDNKTADWLRNDEMNKFLRPETLFGTKFEAYLNERSMSDAEMEFDRLIRELS